MIAATIPQNAADFVPVNPAAPKPKHHMRVCLYRRLPGDRIQYMGTHSLFTESDGFAATVLAVREAFPGCLIEDSWEIPEDVVLPEPQQPQLAIAA